MSELGPTLTSSDRTDLGDIDATDMRHDVATDVDEILEHVINGNMLSMPYSVYVELFDAVAELGVKVAKIETENAELRETLKRRNRQFETMTDMWAARGAENAKLRELLEAVLQCAGETKRDKGCDACPMYNEPWRNDGTWCLLRPTLRELGVEVD